VGDDVVRVVTRCGFVFTSSTASGTAYPRPRSRIRGFDYIVASNRFFIPPIPFQGVSFRKALSHPRHLCAGARAKLLRTCSPTKIAPEMIATRQPARDHYYCVTVPLTSKAWFITIGQHDDSAVG